MFITPHDTPAIARHIRLIWSCVDFSREDIQHCLKQIPPGSSLLVADADLLWLRSLAPHHNLLRSAPGAVERLRQDGDVAETMTLYEHCLPSQVTDHPPRAAIALDIIMHDHTEEAWEEAERLIADGLPSQIAASALIGSPSEIAQRLGDYRKLGLYDIILTAPASRAPYQDVQDKLKPILRHQVITPEGEARIAGISNGPFEWHGATL